MNRPAFKQLDETGILFRSYKTQDGIVMHVLKCIEPYYYEIYSGRKTFELRKDDREIEYSAGDSLILYQFKDGIMTGDYICRKVTYVLRFSQEYGLMAGHVIMSIK